MTFKVNSNDRLRVKDLACKLHDNDVRVWVKLDMTDISNILKLNPFSLYHDEKDKLFQKVIKELTRYHYVECEPYRRILDVLGYDPKEENRSLKSCED